MDHEGIGNDTNHALARDYWYLAAGVVGFAAAVSAINHAGTRKRYGAPPPVPESSVHG